MKQIIAWHGRTVCSPVFHRKYCGSLAANDQAGPGFYFTASREDALRYGNFLIKAVLNVRRWVPKAPALPRKVARHLFDCCPKSAKRRALEDWAGCGGARGLIASLGKSYNAAAELENYWYDLYGRKNTSDYLRAVSAYYQGLVIGSESSTIMHYVIFDPDSIEIESAELISG